MQEHGSCPSKYYSCETSTALMHQPSPWSHCSGTRLNTGLHATHPHKGQVRRSVDDVSLATIKADHRGAAFREGLMRWPQLTKCTSVQSTALPFNWENRLKSQPGSPVDCIIQNSHSQQVYLLCWRRAENELLLQSCSTRPPAKKAFPCTTEGTEARWFTFRIRHGKGWQWDTLPLHCPCF